MLIGQNSSGLDRPVSPIRPGIIKRTPEALHGIRIIPLSGLIGRGTFGPNTKVI